MLKMDSSRLPRICFNGQLHLFKSDNYDRMCNIYNWVAQFNTILAQVNFTSLWDDLRPESWKAKQGDFFERYLQYLKAVDFALFLNSGSSQVPIPRLLDEETCAYVRSRNPMAVLRVMAQLRLANSYVCSITINGNVHKLDPKQVCSICNLSEEETVLHFVSRCPIYGSIRDPYLRKHFDAYASSEDETLILLLNNTDKKIIKAIFNYTTSSLRLRAFIINE